MNKGVVLIILGLVILAGIIALGYFVWRKNSPKAAADVSTPKSENKAEETKPDIPVVTVYQVPILMYHYIRDASGESELGQNLSVHPDNFAAQVKWLKDNGYQTIKMTDLADPKKETISKVLYEKKKPIVLTFDDGYEDAYTQALPILQDNDFMGTFYIIRDFVGRPEYMNQEQIDAMAKAGMEIGSHSVSHPDLSSLDTTEAAVQIFDSKKEATTFCYPAGKYNETTVSLVKEAGYTTAVTTHGGIADQDSNLFELPRVRIENGGAEYLSGRLKTNE